MWTLSALALGCVIDLLVGDPGWIPHPIMAIGKLISFLEKILRALFPKTKKGEIAAGAVLCILTMAVSFVVPLVILQLLGLVSSWLRFAAETIMCWQILAAKSLKDESMKVYRALKTGDIGKARKAVSMIVGRDTQDLSADAVARAAVETVAENTSDGVIAPLIFLAVGGAPLGFLYKAVNTMDSMLGYVEPPYKNIGLVPARTDDVFNFIPARVSALLLALGALLIRFIGRFRPDLCRTRNDVPDIANGFRIFVRDRYNHASPNSAQTESMCAGLLDIQLAGDAWYHGVLHRKKFIGDPIRQIEPEDIIRVNRIMYAAASAGAVILLIIRALAVL